MFSLKRELERKNYVALHKFCDSGDASREETPALCEAVPFWLGTSRDGLELGFAVDLVLAKTRRTEQANAETGYSPRSRVSGTRRQLLLV